MTASPPFMSAEPTPPQHVAVDLRGGVVVGRHRVEVAGDDQALRPTAVGAGHHVVAHPVDGQVGQRPQLLLDVVGQRRLVVALRGDGNEIGGALDQIGHERARLRRAGPRPGTRSPGVGAAADRGPP